MQSTQISMKNNNPIMQPKFSINSFCKIDKTPFFETIFRKSKMDIYKCPFSKISIDFLTHFFKSGENLLLFLSLKTIKIRLEITFVEYLLYYTKNNSCQTTDAANNQ